MRVVEKLHSEDSQNCFNCLFQYNGNGSRINFKTTLLSKIEFSKINFKTKSPLLRAFSFY
ncbi:hypothetical protein [Leptospira kirschneri]|uniref:hypothetical protein n=1 Tax=Leptospira kirschneri TaxID=29507 RepID=UPI000C1FB128